MIALKLRKKALKFLELCRKDAYHDSTDTCGRQQDITLHDILHKHSQNSQQSLFTCTNSNGLIIVIQDKTA